MDYWNLIRGPIITGLALSFQNKSGVCLNSRSRFLRPEALVVGLSLNGLGVARCLGRAGVKVIGLTEDGIAYTGRSRYICRALTWSSNEPDGLVRALLELAQGAPRRVLLVTGDDHVQAIADHQKKLKPHYDFLVPQADQTNRLIRKASFLKLATELGLDLPRSAVARAPREIPAAAARVGLPCLIKPEEKTGEFNRIFGAKAIICRSQPELERLRDTRYSFTVPLLVQEWIPGSDSDVFFTLHYFNRDSDCLISFAGRKIRQTPPRAGHTASAESVQLDELVETSNRFFRGVGMVGLCSMEYKWDVRNGRFVAIEPTIGRTDWQSAVADVNGVPISLAAYCDLTGQEPPPKASGQGRRRWVEFEGDTRSALYYWRNGELTVTEWLSSIRSFTPAVAAFDDPLPFAVYLIQLPLRLIRKVLGRHP